MSVLVLFTILLMCILLIAIFRNPADGLIVAFLIKPIVELTWETKFGPISLIDLFYTIVPVLLLPQVISRIPRTANWAGWIQLALALTLANMLGTFGLMADAQYIPAAEYTVKALNIFAAFILVPLLITDEKRFRLLLLAIIIGNLIPCGIGVFQALTGTIWRERTTVGLSRYVGLYHDATGVRFNGQQAIFACYLLLNFLPSRGTWQKWLLYAYMATWFVVLFFAFSKAAVVTIVLWVGILCLSERKFSWLIALTLLVLAVDYYSESGLSSKLTQLFSKEIAYHRGELNDDRLVLAGRLFIWEDAMHYWNRASAIEQMFGTSKNFSVHNEFLRIMIYSGYLGLALFSFVMLAAGLKFLLPVFYRMNTIQIGAALACTMMWIDAMGLHPCLYSGHQWFVWGFMGLAAVTLRTVPTPARHPHPTRRQHLLHSSRIH